jgi:hypothetical protein
LSPSPPEVSALLEVPERRVRKEIEHGLLPSPRLDFDMIVYAELTAKRDGIRREVLFT